MLRENDQIPAPFFRAVGYLWAFAVFFSFFSFSLADFDFSWITFLTAYLPFLSALLIITRGPTKRVLLFGFFSYVLSSGLALPLMPNHRYVLLFLTLFLIIIHLKSFNHFKDKLNLDIALLKGVSLKSFRVLIIIFYLFTAFIKLNSAYFDPEKSCAVVFLKHIIGDEVLGYGESLFAYSAIYGSILIEFLIPILFIFKKVNLALLIGLAFHFILALDIHKYFTNFSAVMFLLLLLASGKESIEFIYSEGRKLVYKFFRRRLYFNLTFLIVCILLFYLSIAFSSVNLESTKKIYFTRFIVVRHVLWLLYGGTILSFGLRFILLSKINISEESKELRLGWMEKLILLLVVLNGLTPYFGLKSRTAFNMYANDQIDVFQSNHFVVSNWFYPDRIARIGGGEGEMYCKGVLRGQTTYPLFEILRAIKTCPNDVFEFSYGGEEVSSSVYTSTSEEAQELIRAHTGWFSRKFFTYKPVGPRSETECIW